MHAVISFKSMQTLRSINLSSVTNDLEEGSKAYLLLKAPNLQISYALKNYLTELSSIVAT